MSISVRKGVTDCQSGGQENRPSETATHLQACIWYRLLCHKCGECYTAQPSPVDSLECPKCKQQISAQYLYKGLTSAKLPHFSALRRWVDVDGSRTIEQRANFVNNDLDFRRKRDERLTWQLKENFSTRIEK